MSKVYAVFPNDYKQSMSVHPMIKPSEQLEKLGVTCLENRIFFDDVHKQVNIDDIVIFWIGIKENHHIDIASEMKCRKFLRNVDSCSSDRILFRKELELAKKISFEAILVTYCTDFNLKFLSEKGIRSIKYPHLIDFENSRFNAQKTFDILISGQLSEKSYPMRTRLAKLYSSLSERYKVGMLPHPGHKISEVRHQYFGEKYIDLASQAKTGVVCTGDDDSLVMKYLEFAKALTLPVGDAPSNIPDQARESMILTNHGLTDSEIIQNFEKILFDNNQLEQRTLKYHKSMKDHFDISRTTDIIDKVLKGSYDA